MTDRPPFSYLLRISDLPAKKPRRFNLVPEATARKAIADDLGIFDVNHLSFSGELRPSGRHDWHLTAELGAVVVQPCVVTLAPVTSEIREKVERKFIADLDEPEGDEIEMPEDDTVEHLGSMIDLGAVLVEALALALPPYPRCDGAELGSVTVAAPGVVPLTDETLRPFAGLADLMKKPDSDAS